MATKTVLGIFANERVAEEAVNDLRRAGFDRDISIVAKDEQKSDKKDDDSALNMGTLSTGATSGGVLGGLAGLAMGAGALVVPGLGPLVAAGPIAGLLSGAATGGIAGSLVDWGIPEAEGKRYEEDIKKGKLLVAVRTDEKKSDEAVSILKNHGAENVKIH